MAANPLLLVGPTGLGAGVEMVRTEMRGFDRMSARSALE